MVLFNQKSLFLIIVGAALYVYLMRGDVAVPFGNARPPLSNADRRTLAYKNG